MLSPSTEVGRRLPHVALTSDDGLSSTLDLIEGRFTVLSLNPDSAWDAAVAAVSNEYPALRYQSITDARRTEVEPGTWIAAAALGPDDVLLVRPDSHIAHRFRGASTASDQRAAMQAVHSAQS